MKCLGGSERSTERKSYIRKRKADSAVRGTFTEEMLVT